MRRFLQIVLALVLVGIPVAAQSVPEIPFDSNGDLLKPPANIHLGEVGGVATNSKGDVFVYSRMGHPTITIGTARPFAHGGSRLFQFDRSGKFVREIGQGLYGFLVAQQVRIDPQDNVWVVGNGHVARCWLYEQDKDVDLRALERDHRPRHQRSRVQADRAALDQPQAAHGDQVGRPGAGADEMHGHCGASSK